MTVEAPVISVRVQAIADEGPGIRSYELVAENGEPLPDFSAGAHVDVLITEGIVRSYSICSPPGQRASYRLCVALEVPGGGGSRHLHANVAPGDTMKMSRPRNHFPLNEAAKHNVLIAGGIGITPLWSMVQRLEAIGKSWELHVCARTRSVVPFRKRLMDLANAGRRIDFYFSRESEARRIDMDRLIQASAKEAHFYCCGPSRMLEQFGKATVRVPSEQVHVEYFSAAMAPALEKGFRVVLARCGEAFDVPPGKTILQVLTENGVRVPHSCQEGTCGSCETVVVKGRPDHRDSILSEAERMAGETMMICCSGSLDDELILEL